MPLDVVCGMIVDEKSTPAETKFRGTHYYFCATYCREAFEKDPQRFINGTGQWGEAIDPVCGMDVKEEEAAARYEYKGKTYYLCAVGCEEKFSQGPERFLRKERK
jgi:Cu+-exporting ATPase